MQEQGKCKFSILEGSEALKMKKAESVKDYSDSLMKVVNKIRLLGDDLPDKRVEKVLINLPEKLETKISSLEDSRDLSTITLSKLINVLQATKQRRLFRQEEQIEGALFVKGKYKTQTSFGGKKHQPEKFEGNKNAVKTEDYPPCPHCKKKGHSPKRCWFRPDVQYRTYKQFGHIEKVCKNKKVKQDLQQAQVAENQQQDQHEEYLFIAINHKMCSDVGTWLLDSGCTHHMT